MEAALSTLYLGARKLFLTGLLAFGQWVAANQFTATVLFATIGYALVFRYKRYVEQSVDWSQLYERPRANGKIWVEFLRMRMIKAADDGFCSDMSCIRCCKPSAVLSKALDRISLAREHEEGEGETEKQRGSWQELECCVRNAQLKMTANKTGRIFEYPGIPKKAYWDGSESGSLAEDLKLLEANVENILSEYVRVTNRCNWQNWRSNEAAKGNWNLYYLVNQGEILSGNVQLCPQTFRLVSQLKNFLGEGNTFCNVAFSILVPGTKVAAHYGPTNIRLRCHLPLEVPDYCHISVDGEFRCWFKGQCLLFDDFLLHSVRNDALTADCVRVVLLLDLWHPAIPEDARPYISHAFRRDDEVISSCSL